MRMRLSAGLWALALAPLLLPLPARGSPVACDSADDMGRADQIRHVFVAKVAQKARTETEKQADRDELDRLMKGLPGKAPSTIYSAPTPDEQSARGKERAIQRFDENRKLEAIEKFVK